MKLYRFSIMACQDFCFKEKIRRMKTLNIDDLYPIPCLFRLQYVRV